MAPAIEWCRQIASRARRNAERTAKRHHIAKVFDTYEELLDDPSIEVLDIAVPPNAQLGLIKAACQRRTVRGILAQKPLAMDYQEALEAVINEDINWDGKPVLIDRYLEDAFEVDVDALCDGERVVIGGIMQLFPNLGARRA